MMENDDSSVVAVHSIWATLGVFLIMINGYFIYMTSYERKQLHVFVTGHLLADCLLGVFVLFTATQWLLIGIPDSGVRCDVLSMVEMVFMILPVFSVVSVTFARKKRLLDDEPVSGSPPNYVMVYFSVAVFICVVVIELVGAAPTKFGCIPDWQGATLPLVFLSLGCLCIFWVFFCYFRIYRRVAAFTPSQFQTEWKMKQEHITFTTLSVVIVAVACYVPNISSALLLYMERNVPPGLRVVQFTSRLLMGLLSPFIYGLGIPSIRQHTPWARTDPPKLPNVTSVFSGNRNDDSDLCYFPINQLSSREPGETHHSRSSLSAKERSSFDQSSDDQQHESSNIQEKSRGANRPSSRTASNKSVKTPRDRGPPEPFVTDTNFHDEGRRDIVGGILYDGM